MVRRRYLAVFRAATMDIAETRHFYLNVPQLLGRAESRKSK